MAVLMLGMYSVSPPLLFTVALAKKQLSCGAGHCSGGRANSKSPRPEDRMMDRTRA